MLSTLIIKQSSKELRYCTVRVVPESYILELLIFVLRRLALHQNGVEFRQQSIGALRQNQSSYVIECRLTSRDVAEKLADHARTHTHAQTHNTTWRQHAA